MRPRPRSVTGVSPVVMSDVSSGMNILTDAYQEPTLNALCGFRDAEIVDLLEQLHDEGRRDGKYPNWTVDEVRSTIRDWYNGYRFSPLEALPAAEPTPRRPAGRYRMP